MPLGQVRGLISHYRDTSTVRYAVYVAVNHHGEPLFVDESIGMLRVVTLQAHALGNLPSDVGTAGLLGVFRARSMANFALDVPQWILGLAHVVSVLGAEPNDMAGDAHRLVMAVLVEEGLVCRGVWSALPLGNLLLVTASAPFGAGEPLCLHVRLASENGPVRGL